MQPAAVAAGSWQAAGGAGTRLKGIDQLQQRRQIEVAKAGEGVAGAAHWAAAHA